ncbi:MAG: HAMP domain-containing protein [Nitrospirae bacterium]|nr:HAMP domain-containing protein [Nitrospirota bacterium]
MEDEPYFVKEPEGGKRHGGIPPSLMPMLLRALRAAKNGDFTTRLPEDERFGEVAVVFNELIGINQGITNEIMRISKAIGEEGKLTERASLSGIQGAWMLNIESFNSLINAMAQPTTEVGRVITAVAEGDLSKKMRMEIEGKPLKGEFARIGTIVNTMVGQLGLFASEVTRVSKEVGTEGKLGGQAKVEGIAGTWKELTYNVNAMASSLTSQVRDIAKVTTAVANGDMSQKITVEAKGEILQLKETVNKMVDQLSAFASEVTRVAREVGTDGKLGGQAEVKGVAGTWKELTDNVNMMANNLTSQVRNIADVTTAVANGDLSKKITVEVKGEMLELKDTINTMVDQLNAFASEVTRVAREVGVDGKLGGQAQVKGVAGTWKELTDNVNMMANNLTSQVRNIASVTTAVATGDLSKKITVEAKGEILELKNTVNIMVDQLNAFASEVTRVAREVGAEGKLGGQAEVRGVGGTWRELTENVNMMASNLTSQVRNIASVTTAVANGDLSQKITVEAKGEIRQLKDTINRMVDQLNGFASEVTRVAREVGTDGKLGGQAEVKGVGGTWKDLTDNVNMLVSNLTNQVRNIASVATAVANGDLSKKITVEARGEIMELKNTINTMVDQLNGFASEVTRVAREVGTDGKLGGQAEVKGVGGTWKELTENVNMMASNLTSQVRNIAGVTTAVANGDLSQKIVVDARGEILELKNTINGMVDNLNTIIGEINDVMAMVGEGNLTKMIEVKALGEFNSMVDGINGTMESLRGIVTELREAGINIGSVSQNMLSAGQEMNAMVTQLSSSVGQIAEGAKGQASQIAAASKESEGVGKTASNTLGQAESMNEAAEVANRAAAEGGKAMGETIKYTDLMLDGSKESVARIESLSKSSEQIQEIVEVIRDIATQTNILAINAAIEAVRAGKL